MRWIIRLACGVGVLVGSFAMPRSMPCDCLGVDDDKWRDAEYIAQLISDAEVLLYVRDNGHLWHLSWLKDSFACRPVYRCDGLARGAAAKMRGKKLSDERVTVLWWESIPNEGAKIKILSWDNSTPLATEIALARPALQLREPSGGFRWHVFENEEIQIVSEDSSEEHWSWGKLGPEQYTKLRSIKVAGDRVIFDTKLNKRGKYDVGNFDIHFNEDGSFEVVWVESRKRNTVFRIVLASFATDGERKQKEKVLATFLRDPESEDVMSLTPQFLDGGTTVQVSRLRGPDLLEVQRFGHSGEIAESMELVPPFGGVFYGYSVDLEAFLFHGIDYSPPSGDILRWGGVSRSGEFIEEVSIEEGAIRNRAVLLLSQPAESCYRWIERGEEEYVLHRMCVSADWQRGTK